MPATQATGPLRLTPHDVAALPHRLPHLVRDARPGAVVVVDVSSAAPPPADLGLLLTVLWRRVGPTGQVHLTGASAAQLLTWDQLGLTPARIRQTVYGAGAPRPTAPRAQDVLTSAPAQRAAPADRLVTRAAA